MKNGKRICLPVTLLLLCFALTLGVLAAGSARTEGFVENPDGVLTVADATSLQSAAAEAAVQVGVNVGVIFTDSGYSESRLRDLADRLYDRECDEKSDAIILAVDVSSRNYYIRTIGRMNDNLSGSALDRIENQTKSRLKESNWKSAGLSFIGAVCRTDTGGSERLVRQRESGFGGVYHHFHRAGSRIHHRRHPRLPDEQRAARQKRGELRQGSQLLAG